MTTAYFWRCGLLAGLLALINMSVSASVVDGLYDAKVPVPNQSISARHIAMQQALAAVLVKITGEPTAGGVPALHSLIQEPDRFLQQYRYEQSSAASQSSPVVTYYDLTRTGAPAIVPTGLLLWAQFDPAVVNQAVRAAHEPLWGRERPVTLVWAAYQGSSGTAILSANTQSPARQAMVGAASQRGVPVVFPLMDIKDQQALSVHEVARDDVRQIELASQRYHPDATLVGTIYRTGPGQYAAHWQLGVGTRSESWDAPTGDLSSVATEGIQRTAGYYAQWFAVGPDAAGLNGVPVTVAGITSVGAYAKVLAYLGRLTPVKSVQVTRVERGRMEFSINTRGGLGNLREAILLGGLLKPATTGPSTVAPAANPSLLFKYGP